jgi:hypothetical protein
MIIRVRQCLDVKMMSREMTALRRVAPGESRDPSTMTARTTA